jgi:SAM-dependent methyltransferase
MSELPDDMIAHRDWLQSFMPVCDGGLIVDLGCGAGQDLFGLARKHPGVTARFVGLDASQKSVADASARGDSEPRVSFAAHDLDQPLPFDGSSLDGVFTNNLLECLGDQAMFAREIGRVLRPGGTLVAAHWDCDSQVFDGRDKARTRRLVHAFADWQQPWMKHADGWMGRRLWGTFQSTGLFAGTVQARVLTNTIFAAPWYGHARAQDFRALSKRALVSAGDVSGFLEEQAALQANGRYFYAITGMAYVGTRIN